MKDDKNSCSRRYSKSSVSLFSQICIPRNFIVASNGLTNFSALYAVGGNITATTGGTESVCRLCLGKTNVAGRYALCNCLVSETTQQPNTVDLHFGASSYSKDQRQNLSPHISNNSNMSVHSTCSLGSSSSGGGYSFKNANDESEDETGTTNLANRTRLVVS